MDWAVWLLAGAAEGPTSSSADQHKDSGGLQTTMQLQAQCCKMHKIKFSSPCAQLLAVIACSAESEANFIATLKTLTFSTVLIWDALWAGFRQPHSTVQGCQPGCYACS